MHSLAWIESANPFMPHSFCYLWNQKLIWLHAVSDSVVAIAYLSIPITLVHFVRKRRDVPFDWVFGCFALFILACGGTHIMEVVTLWVPAYWFSGGLKALTAVVSIITAVLLIRIVPKALALPRPEELKKANAALQTEILERQQAEESVRKLNHNLALHAAELSIINNDLQSFTYSVSHDLRAPLRHIAGFSRILLDDFGPSLAPTAKHHLQRIEEGTHRMGQLVDELLNLTHMGRRPLALQLTSLDLIVQEALAFLEAESQGRRVEWKIADLPSVECDPTLMRLVFQNLISNALKYSRPRSPALIEIGQSEINGQLVIFTRDNGVGFSMKYADRLFGVFQRLHRAEDFEGMGVGLATVHRIIQKHGGRIWAEAEPDKGATFYFTLEGLQKSESHNAIATAGGQS
jgi:signal transduction histidine kinase